MNPHADDKSKGIIHCVLSLIGIGTREARPQCASVPVQWIERDAKAEWRAAKCEYLCCRVMVCHWGGETVQKMVQKNRNKETTQLPVTQWATFLKLPVAFHSSLLSHTTQMHVLLFSFCFLTLHFKLCLLFLLLRRSVSCAWNRRVLLEKYLTCRRRWSGRIKKLGYGLWARSFVFNKCFINSVFLFAWN